jgi:flagellar motility protein MotE (MotC chaperone)
LAGAAVLALVMTAATPACAKDETIFSNFLNALVPNAIAARSEQPPAPTEAETKAAPRKGDSRPIAIRPRVPAKLAVARPPKPSAARETLPPDPTITTGATAQATPTPQAQPQPQPQSQTQGPPPAAAAAPAAAKPAAKSRTDAAAKPVPQPKSVPQPKPAPASPAGDADSEAALFCRNITDAATDARFSWQVRVLEDLDKQVKESVTRLEAKRAEYEDWLKRREDFLRRVEDGVVDMYGRMRPDAAALQIASMTEEVALSVLMKLKPRASSAILSEMEPARAARLTDSLAGVRLTTQQGKTP